MIGSSIMVLMLMYSPIFSQADSGPYQLVSEFSRDSMANGQSTGIFVDDGFNIYVTEPSLHLVQVFDQSGKLIRSLSLGPTGQPVDIAIDTSGGIFVADMLNGTVIKFVNDKPTSTHIKVDGSCGLDVDNLGNLYLRGRNEVLKFNSIFHLAHIITFVSSNTNGLESCPIEVTDHVYYTRNQRIETSTTEGSARAFTPDLPDNTVFDIAGDRLGNVFVMTAPWEIKKLDSSGKFITGFDFEDEFFSNHTGTFWNSKITTDLEDNVYVLDSTHGKVLKFKQGGFGPPQMDVPRGIAQHSSGNVFVADTGNHRIQEFTNSGDLINRWGHEGTSNGQFEGPVGVAVDSSGNVFVADTFNHRIQKFTNNGTFITKWGSSGSGDNQFSTPQGITTDSLGNVYIADTGNNRIQKFTNDGKFIIKWGSDGSGNGQFNFPTSVAVDSSDNLFVADFFNNRIQKFHISNPCPTGTTQVVPGVCSVTKWGTRGSGNGEFDAPTAVAVDLAGNVFVADTVNDRIQKFTNNGTFITKWGSHCQLGNISGCIDPDGTGPLLLGDGQFFEPNSVAVDLAGNVFAADTDNDRIQKFTNNGTFITKWGSEGNL